MHCRGNPRGCPTHLPDAAEQINQAAGQKTTQRHQAKWGNFKMEMHSHN